MDDDAASSLPALAPADAAALQQRARTLVREWLRMPEDAVVAAVGAIGRDAVAHAAAQAARLPAGRSAASDQAEDLLERLRTMVERLAEPDAPPPRTRFRLFAPAPPAPPARADPAATERELGELIGGLGRARDALVQDAVRQRSEAVRIAVADAALERAAYLLSALPSKLDSAARELAAVDPARAAFLRGDGAGLVQERLRDILTQLAVTRQGRLSLGLLVDGQDRMAAAIERTTGTMMAALRTALSARHAIADAARLSVQADALDRTASAAGAADRNDAARRSLADAVVQMRRALDAAATTTLD